MADWKDFYEDNREFQGQYLDSLADQKCSKGKEKTPPAPPLQFCPLCHTAFFEDVELARHVQTIHGPQHIYLRVNGQIIRDIGWAEQGISELRLVLLGFSQAAVEVAGGQFHKKLEVAGDENLKRLIPSGFEGELTLRIEPLGGKAREFTLYSRSLPQFRRGTMDAQIQSWSDQDTKPGGTPDIGRWRELTGDMGVLENRYLNGILRICSRFPPGKQRTGWPGEAALRGRLRTAVALPHTTGAQRAMHPWPAHELLWSAGAGTEEVGGIGFRPILQPAISLAVGSTDASGRCQPLHDVCRRVHNPAGEGDCGFLRR
jgi:hypothetical protein